MAKFVRTKINIAMLHRAINCRLVIIRFSLMLQKLCTVVFSRKYLTALKLLAMFGCRLVKKCTKLLAEQLYMASD